MPQPSPLAAIRVLLAAVLSLASYECAESLASPYSVASGVLLHPSNVDDDGTASMANRVFVAGISPTSDESSLCSAFSQFGSVREVAIIGRDDDDTGRRRRAPYCFVTFDDEPSAQRALASPRPTDLYNEIRPAVPIDSRRRSNRSRAKEGERRDRIRAFAQEANLIVQVQSTHLDRLTAYLHRWSNSLGDENRFKVLGPADTSSKNLSLLFLSCQDPTEVARKLFVDPLLARAVNKSYVVQPTGLLEGNLSTKKGCNELAKTICNRLCDNDDVRSVRMQVYPPKDQRRLLQFIKAIIHNADETTQFTINPKAFTHILSVVEVYRYKGRGWERQQHGENAKGYMVGISTASPELDVVDINNVLFDNGSGDEVSRAYFKLKEAVETYEATRGKLPEGLDGAIALDCGSAPGGWTKYLIERFRCRTVYSIDPGLLAPTVLELEATKHMQMRIQDALPSLLEDGDVKGQVKIWVSDMCLHNMEEQADQLLLARDEGLLAPDAFFVLTLKCTLGHSKKAFDAQVEEVVGRLLASANVRGVETFHLFSNRSGERTVIGRIS